MVHVHVGHNLGLEISAVFQNPAPKPSKPEVDPQRIGNYTQPAVRCQCDVHGVYNQVTLVISMGRV